MVALSGFLVEGLRLAAQRPEWAKFSFAGYWVSLLWARPDAALSIYPYLWWTHALLSLGFIAAIPFSKLFHILAAPASIYLENQPVQAVPAEARGQNEEVFSFRDIIFLDACTRCGRCVEVCPSAGAGEPFAPRDFIVWTRNNLLMKYQLDQPQKHAGTGIRSSEGLVLYHLSGLPGGMPGICRYTGGNSTCEDCLSGRWYAGPLAFDPHLGKTVQI
jgi:ferredoxin